jgi:hypothetical protein
MERSFMKSLEFRECLSIFLLGVSEKDTKMAVGGIPAALVFNP